MHSDEGASGQCRIGGQVPCYNTANVRLLTVAYEREVPTAPVKKRNRKQHKKTWSPTKRRVLRREEFSIGREASYIIESAQQGEGKVVTVGKLVFFSTAEGDAWVLDPEDSLALRLAKEGERLPYRITETGTAFAVEWNTHYALTDNGFAVEDQDGKATVFPTYPVQHIREGERPTSQ